VERNDKQTGETKRKKTHGRKPVTASWFPMPACHPTLEVTSRD
jgi:hypothetical protein